MRKNLFALLAVIGLAATVSGCVNTVDGRRTAAVPFMKDKVEGRYERPVPQVVSAAREVLKFNGVIYSENTVNNSFQAKVNQRTVWVVVQEVDPRVTAVTVQARTRTGGTDIDMAHELEKQIALKLR